MDGWDPNNALVLATAGVTLLAAVVFAATWRSVRKARIEPGPATDELGEEPPALVDLLTGGFVVGDDAVAATLVDLAARRHLSIENVGAGNLVLRVPATPRNDDRLRRYEQRVLDRVHDFAGADRIVPADALTTGPEGLSDRWWKGFVREVTAHGREVGLCTRRWPLRALAPVWVTLVAAAGLAWLTLSSAEHTPDHDQWVTPINVLAVLSMAACAAMVLAALRATRGDAQRPTHEGVERAAMWLGVRRWMEGADYEHKTADHVALWDRLLAYATAMGLTPLILRQFPFAGEHDKQAWSNEGDRWRRVDIRYWSLRPSWGDCPARAILSGVGRTVIWGLLLAVGVALAGADLGDLPDDAVTPVRAGGLVLASVTMIAVARSLWRLGLGLADLSGRRQVEGAVLRHRRLERGHQLPAILRWLAWVTNGDRSTPRLEYWAAIDDGSDDTITAHKMDLRRFGELRQGDRVRLVVTPLLGHVRSVEVLASAAPFRAIDVAHELDTAPLMDAVSDPAQAASQTLAQRFREFAALTDGDGVPVIDLTKDRYEVTLAEGLTEVRGSLDGIADADGTGKDVPAGTSETDPRAPDDRLGDP